MQFFNKKFFLYVTLTLSCGMQISLANPEEDASITAKCPDPYSISTKEDFSKYTISCAKVALEKLGEADDMDSTIKAAKIALKAHDLFAEIDDVKAPSLDEAKTKFKEARAKAVEKLSPFIRSDEKDCQHALEILREISPLERYRLKNRKEKGFLSPCSKERGSANEPCEYKGGTCYCESKFAPISCGCKDTKKWCECENSEVCD